MTRLLAQVESVLQRVAPAVLLLLSARYKGSDVVGVVASISVLLTLYQAMCDWPVRQVGMRCVQAGNHLAGLSRLRWVLAVLGAGLLAAGCSRVAIEASLSSTEVLSAACIGVVPLVSATGLFPMAVLQMHDRWAVLSAARACAVLGGGAVAAIAWSLSGPVAATAALVLVSEAVLVVVSYARARRIVETRAGSTRLKLLVDYVQTSAMHLFGWALSQTERLVLVLLAPASVVGQIGLALSLGRMPPDALCAGINNQLVGSLASSGDIADARRKVRSASNWGVCVAFIWYLCLLALAPTLIRVLGEAWRSSVELACIISISAIPAAHAWSVAMGLNALGRNRGMLAWQVPQILLAVVAGLAFTSNLLLGSSLMVARHMLSAGILSTLFPERSLYPGLPFLSLPVSVILAVIAF